MYQNAYRVITPPLTPFDFRGATQARAGGSPSGFSRASEGRSAGQRKEEGGEVEALRRRIEELEALVPKFSAKKVAGKRKPKSSRRS
jgi:hypothetical protein